MGPSVRKLIEFPPDRIFSVVCWVIVVGVLLLGLIASSGFRILWSKTEELLKQLFISNVRPLPETALLILERRNELWAAHAQLLVAVLVAVLLTVLLLTGTISAEAGLPILSGISGFALAKQSASGRRDPDNRENGPATAPPRNPEVPGSLRK